jgi:type III pantothenate kinase
MRNNLLENTANIAELETGTWHSFPLNTNDAVYSGALSAVAGAVKSVYEKLEQHIGVPPICVVSGGDSQVVIEHLRAESLVESNQLILAENLVLKGLYILENSLTES